MQSEWQFDANLCCSACAFAFVVSPQISVVNKGNEWLSVPVKYQKPIRIYIPNDKHIGQNENMNWYEISIWWLGIYFAYIYADSLHGMSLKSI